MSYRFEMRVDPLTQEIFYAVPLRSTALMQDPLLNKGSCFPREERTEFGLSGLIAERVGSLEEQLERAIQNYRMKSTDLERYITLIGLLDRNETLFYALLRRHLYEMLPIIYTPTVGLACLKLSQIMRRYRGVYITQRNVVNTEQVLRNIGLPDVTLIVVTDGERILGYGDLGVDGMGIPIGKVALYVAAGGIHPASTLPVCIDVGTNNKRLLSDPLYLGTRRPRLKDDAYWEVIERFVQGVRRTFPRALIQWEDFAKSHAFELLDRYQRRIPSFDDDIQGTGATAAAALRTALKIAGRPIEGERILIHGFGQAGSGIAQAIATMMEADAGVPVDKARRAIYAVDQQGLLLEGDTSVELQQRPFLQPNDLITSWNVSRTRPPTLAETVREARITTLIGVSAQADCFDESILHQMAMNCEQPVIFALSNPTSCSETTPEAVVEATEGRALMAFGSPFPPVRMPDGRTITAAQCNNLYIFPGVGLGSIVCHAQMVSDRMFHAAASALSDMVTPEERDRGMLLPDIEDVRRVSATVALAVSRQAREEGTGIRAGDERLRSLILGAMWEPHYYPYRYVRQITE
ncbi:MAG: NAD-dependent malic enzyme [Calditrichaeota bacterium]|nr:NAD-dependent malic enzyme [Calditrichota bacterium]